MRKLTLISASALVLALGATSAFAIPSGDTLGQEEGIAPSYGAHSADVGRYRYRGYNALTNDNPSSIERYDRPPTYDYYRGQ